MKKVAVITFFQSKDNYGQLLQCYALQQALRELGGLPYVIRYGFHYYYIHWFRWQSFFTYSGLSNVLKELKRCCQEQWKPEYYKRRFGLFRREHISFSWRCYNSLEELQSHPPRADIYITGSDQVWAQLINHRDNRSFFLDFGAQKVKRIAYAPSFAMNSYPVNLCKDLKSLLANIDAISVRERTGIKICKKVGVDAKLVSDPTLLLTPINYERITENNTMKRKYCFAYHVNITTPKELYWDVFNKFNKERHLETYATYANPQKGINMKFLYGANYVYPTIQQWLGWVRNAEYVLTSSFHGVVFSILFHVPFIACLLKDSMFAGNDRIITLLEALGLERYIVYQREDIKMDILLSDIPDWNDIDAKIELLRKDSLSFLKQNI